MVSIFTASCKRRFSLLLLFSFLLSACGGGGSTSSAIRAASSPVDASASAQPSESSAPDNTSDSPSTSDTPEAIRLDKDIVTIEYHGDSTIWGYRSGSGDRVATPAPAAFAAALPTPSRYVVRNMGINSADACELLHGGNARYAHSWSTHMAASDADIVIINHAINDQWRMTTDRYASCLDSLASTARSYGKKVIFETPNPTRDSYPGGLEVYANAMKSVASAQGVPVIDQYAYLMHRLNGNYQNVGSIVPDGLHPDDATYVLKGRYAAEIFGKLAS